jgi:hypothetical protein
MWSRNVNEKQKRGGEGPLVKRNGLLDCRDFTQADAEVAAYSL